MSLNQLVVFFQVEEYDSIVVFERNKDTDIFTDEQWEFLECRCDQINDEEIDSGSKL
jgi:hypothetical protein